MKKAKVLGNILFWTTLASPLFSFALVTKIGEADIFGIAGMLRYSWIMWLFIPIGILSIIIGIKLKKNNQKYKKNLIIAFICIPIILIFGSYRFIFNDFTSYDIDKIYAVEEIVNIDLPNEIKIATIKNDSYDETYAKIINNESKTKFEFEIENNPSWQNKLSSKIQSLLPLMIQSELELFDYFIFYNITNGEYNIYPVDGEYECVFIAYDYDLQRLIILDNYKINLN